MAAEGLEGVRADRRPLELRGYGTPWTLRSYASRTEWEERARHIREHILACAGLWPLPDKTPLRPRIFGRLERDGYAVEKVFFESLPGFFVCGNLYSPIPRIARSIPAIACPHGHWKRGRLEHGDSGSVPGRCINLARQGNVVFTYDMAGHNDSDQIDHGGFGGVAEDLWGIGTLGLQLWNSIRVVDFLISLAGVDARRIGCTGASGGATQTFLLGAVDRRVAAAAPVNMISSHMQGGCNCENQSHLRLDINNVEIGAVMAPRPQLLVAATGDWTCNTIEVEYPAIKQIYRLYGAQDRLSVRRCEAPHNYNKESREAVYGFFSKWFHGVDRRSLPESAFLVESDGDLLVFGRTRQKPRNSASAAQLVSMLQARSENRLRGYRPSDRRAWRRLRRDMGGALRHALGIELPSAQQLDIETDRLRRSGKCLAQQLTIGRRERGERIPAVLLSSLPFEEKGPAVLVVHPDGRGALMDGDGASPGALVSDLLRRGFRVLAIDLFQTCDSQSADSQSLDSQSPPTGVEYGAQSIRHFHTYNQSAAACRVQDVLTALAFLSGHSEVSRISLLGLGGAGIYCLLARTQAGSVQRTAVDLTGFDPSSDSHWVRRCFVPAIRAAGDVRTGVSLIAPAHLLIHGAGRGFPTAWARSAYRSAGKPERLVLAMKRRPRARIVSWLAGE